MRAVSCMNGPVVGSGSVIYMHINRYLSAGCAGLALLPVAALAQQPAPGSSHPAIIITGTRMAAPDAAGLEPVQSMDGAYLRNRNLTNIADALNEIPGFRGSETPDGVQGSYGQGVNFINAFRLGSARTLVLVNGRRVVGSNVPTVFNDAAPGNQVDLNLIPAILVRRVDRIAVGGAPVYGSDAIAGTVNVILRDDIEGLELAATGGVSDKGDARRHNLSGAYGTRFADGRGRFTLALSHDKVRGVRQSARGFFRANLAEVPNIGLLGTNPATDGRLNPGIGYDTGPADGTPGTVLVRDMAIPLMTEGGLIFGGALGRRVQFDPSGNLVPFDGGTPFGPFASGGDGVRLNDYGQITSDLSRFSASLMGGLDLSDSVRLSAELHHARSRADELVDQPNFNALLFSGVSGPLLFPVTNPFLTDQARGLLLANGYRAFILSRANADLGDLTGFAKTRQTRGVLALDGGFAIGERAFRFGLAATYGQTRVTDHDQQINQQAFINAINVRYDASRGIVCDAAPLFTVGGTPVADPACEPLNLFGAGAPSAAARRYVLADVTAQSRLEQRSLSAHLAGSPFTLFGQDVEISLGAEHRVEKARFTPDLFQQLGLGRSVPTAAVAGRIRWTEVFGELLVPLITPDSGGPVHRLEIHGRARHSHTSLNGGFASWAAGGRMMPVRAVELRGNVTRSFRTPSIREVFSPLTPARLSVPDLCSTANRNGGPAPDIRARNCAGFLNAYPGATPLNASLVTVPGLAGGNRDLANERGDSFTFGLTLKPGFPPGLVLSADYIDITIRRAIAYLSAAEIASACFDNADFNLADPARGNAFCALIGRDDAGQVLADPLAPPVRTGFVNGHRIHFGGIQGTLAYQTALDGLGLPGTISLAGDLFHVRRRVQNLAGVNRLRTDGLIGDPRIEAQARLDYAAARWGFGLHLRYTGPQRFSRDGNGPAPNDAREISALKAFATVNAHIFAAPVAGLRANLAVTNLFNRHGQGYFGALIPASIHDPLGRRYALSLSRVF